jgi:putative tryptophan/tyrosine transport system substrate-binding protein
VKRRDFIALVGGAAAWPLVARAQQPDRMRHIGIMMAPAADDPAGEARVKAFRQRLQELGWTEGGNLRIDYRWAAGPDSSANFARELVALAPDVIVANGTPALTALHQATRTIPVVFVVVVDPVGAGYVQSLARPSANITGFSTFEPEMGTKWLELLKEITPDLKRIAVIWDPGFKGFARILSAIESTASRLGLEITTVSFHDDTDDIEAAVAAFAQQPNGGLIVLPTTLNHVYRHRIYSLAALHRLPAIYPFRHYATEGGLMCYGFDSIDLFRRGASYVDRILRGEKPADLPVQAPTKFELVINLKTAKALGLDVPWFLQQRADEVIE